VKAATLRTQTDGVYLVWLPLVTDENRRGYEEYTKLNQGHLLQSYGAEEGFRAQQDTYFGLGGEESDVDGGANRQLYVAGPDVHPVMHNEIWGGTVSEHESDHVQLGFSLTSQLLYYSQRQFFFSTRQAGDNTDNEAPEGSGPYLACWQLSPIIPLPVLLNFNFFNYYDLAPTYHEVLKTGKAALGYLQTKHTSSATAALIRTYLTLGQYRHSEVAYDEDPMTQVVSYLVFDNFGPDRQVTGIMVVTRDISEYIAGRASPETSLRRIPPWN
jgi:hypothetical protein